MPTRNRDIPRLMYPLIVMAWSAIWVLVGIGVLIDPGGMNLLNNLLTIAIYLTIFILTYQLWYKNRIAARQKWREERFQEWLKQEPTPSPKQEDWVDIEYAMGVMIEAGIDPTYERAEDLLRRCRRTKQERELQRASMRVKGRDIKRVIGEKNPFYKDFP